MTREELGALKTMLHNAFVLRGVARERQAQADTALKNVLTVLLDEVGEHSERVAQVFDAVASMEIATDPAQPSLGSLRSLLTIP